ncbi:DUF4247 domain-containing protein [Phytohabitans suffuscus]|uniref:DUF4247 domain-containing protein n=1 Tax=Phytohabitans suffuscus TaxID=624315 RepID=A0A6F8YVQ4_9ACTN|nr:DUF4247 domain-containing protein [Phytohabitans suffuscus]BCB90255.1 hypothetical protein Psuf_075680 [Phytohabitans suffuscus]
MGYRGWFVVGIGLALVGVLVAGVGLLTGSFSPRGYVAESFARDTSRDIGADAVAYTSSEVPSAVADQITGVWEPADRYVDGSGVYLRYDDDAVVILPLAAVGSLILVERMATAYPRYHGTVGNYWGWGRGTSVRGGGPGAGK